MPREHGHEGSILEGSDSEFDARPTAVKRYSQQHRNETGDESMITDHDDERDNSGRYSNTSEDRQRLREPSFPVEHEKQMEMADLGESQVKRGSLRRRITGPSIERHMSSEEREAQQARDEAQQSSGEDDAAGLSFNAQPVRAIDHAEANDVTTDEAKDSATKENAAERNREDYDVDAFAHPASKEPQRIVWLPEDELGLAVAEVQDNQSIGILSTTKDAVLDSKVSNKQAGMQLWKTDTPFGRRARWKSTARLPTISRVRMNKAT
jgi:hypothetical protein